MIKTREGEFLLRIIRTHMVIYASNILERACKLLQLRTDNFTVNKYRRRQLHLKVQMWSCLRIGHSLGRIANVFAKNVTMLSPFGNDSLMLIAADARWTVRTLSRVQGAQRGDLFRNRKDRTLRRVYPAGRLIPLTGKIACPGPCTQRGDFMPLTMLIEADARWRIESAVTTQRIFWLPLFGDRD